MVLATFFNCIHCLLRDIMKCEDKFFGTILMSRKVMLFDEDFRQVLPVIQKGKKVQILGFCVSLSRILKSVIILHLTQNMRAHAELRDFLDCN